MSWAQLFSTVPTGLSPFFGQGIAEQRPKSSRTNYQEWLTENFPHVATQPFGDRHIRLWDWFHGLVPGQALPPRVEVWPRGGAKSATAELGVAYVGTRLTRRFCLYVSETQDQADKHVQAIAGMMERLGYGPALNKEGHSRGWRRNQLRCSNGFNVAALGLDTAARGIKLDEFRPDLQILDDIDGRHDTPKTTTKKESAITTTILPAGSTDCAILFLQNLIHEDGVVARMVDGRADYLLSAEIRGPEPAIQGLETVDDVLPNGRPYKRIISGVATWAGQSIDICQRQIVEWGWSAFKREAQHLVKGVNGFFFNEEKFIIADELPEGIRLRLVRAWDLAGTQNGGDYTVGVLMGVAENGNFYVLDVIRVQFEPNGVRDLILRTAARDLEGWVYGPDELNDRGFIREPGQRLFSFADAVKGKVLIHLPQDPAQAGKFQAQQYSAVLKGYDVQIASVSGAKATRAEGHADAVNDGRVTLILAPWNWAYVEEHRLFREDEQHDYDDQIDPSADAHNVLAKPRRKLAAA